MSKKADNSWVLVGKDGRTHDLSHGMIFIGREECDIVLQAASADKRHAVLCYNNGEQKFHIKDLNSLTGTYVNGIRIAEQTYVKLKRLDCIRFGYGPDVFYLDKSSSATSPSKEETSKDLEKEVVKHPTEENSKGRKSPLKPDESSAKKISPNSELPSLTREDNPPDTLPLNLPNSKQQDKDWDWIGQDGALSDSPDYSQRSETSSCSAPPNCGTTTGDERDTGSAHSSPAATAFTIAFETEANTPRKKLGIRDSISKFAPNKIDSENRVTFQKSSKTEPSPKKLPLTDGKPPIPKARTQFGTADLKDINEEIGKITDSTSFLIKKMLNGEVSPEIPEELNNKEKHPPGQNDVDERSEAGTYTVETEQADCDVEEARKKIDEVFGVIQLSNSVQSSSYSSSTTSSSNKQIPRLNGRLKQPILKTPINPKQRESGMNWSASGKTYGRTRGQGPTPAASTESLNHSDTLPRSLQRTRKISDPPGTPDRTRRAKLASSPKSPGKTKTPSTLKSPGSLSNNLSAAPSSRESLNRDEMTRRHSTDSRSEGSKSPHTSVQWQKVPWNLSGSDLDLDRSKSENNSILSDTSTEPSSHSSHSGQSRPDQGPQMRLNRAFALRRARLEAESGKRGKENRTSTTSSQPKPMKKSGKLSSSTSTLRDESSSGGGGGSSSSKMSYRLSSNITKPFTGRQLAPQCSDPLKRKIVSSHNMDDYQCRSSSKEITALDSLVISAIHQLASKLWSNSKHLLERERKKCPKGSDTWLMIDEVLPQVPVTGTPEDGDFTKDLSSILKNLKRVEQGLDVLSSILENGRDPEPGVLMQEKGPLPQNFFVVNM